MSTTTQAKEQAQELRNRAAVLDASAEDLRTQARNLEEQVRQAERRAAQERVGEVLGEIQESNHGAEAVYNLTLSAADDFGAGPEAEWSPYTLNLFRGFATVFTLDYNALVEWVTDVASDLAHDLAELEGDRAEQEYQTLQESKKRLDATGTL